MMANADIALDFIAYRGKKDFKPKLLNSPSVMRLVDSCGERVQKRASNMFYATSYRLKKAKKGKTRCHAFVVTGSHAAMRDNAKHMTLKKSI